MELEFYYFFGLIGFIGFLLNYFSQEEWTIKEFFVLIFWSCIPVFNILSLAFGCLLLCERNEFIKQKIDFINKKINAFLNKKTTFNLKKNKLWKK